MVALRVHGFSGRRIVPVEAHGLVAEDVEDGPIHRSGAVGKSTEAGEC